MTDKFYQFDYAEMRGITIKNMGILNICSSTTISKESLKTHARQHLKNPDANILISNITRLTRAEFELVTNTKFA